MPREIAILGGRLMKIAFEHWICDMLIFLDQSKMSKMRMKKTMV